MVSHDRFFLDRCAEVIYEISGKKLIRYVGNYTQYRQEKQKRLRLQKKTYERQQQELERLNQVVERLDVYKRQGLNFVPVRFRSPAVRNSNLLFLFSCVKFFDNL